jgi:drug/metabolite transporter (DMT)-like permease
MRKILGAGTLVVGVLCIAFGVQIGANLFDSYDEEMADWIFVLVAAMSLGVGLACLRLTAMSFRRTHTRARD